MMLHYRIKCHQRSAKISCKTAANTSPVAATSLLNSCTGKHHTLPASNSTILSLLCALGHVNLLSDAWNDLCSEALNTLLHAALPAADASLLNFAAGGVVQFQDDDRGWRHVGWQCFWLFCICWVHIIEQQRNFTKHMWIVMLFAKCSRIEKLTIVITVRWSSSCDPGRYA